MAGYEKSDTWFDKVIMAIRGKHYKGKKKPNSRSVLNPDVATRRELKRSGLSDKDIDSLGIGG